MKWLRVVENWLDRQIPPALTQAPETARRAQLLVALSYLCAAASLFYATLCIFAGKYTAAGVVAAGAPLFWSVPVYLRRCGSLRLSGQLCAALLLAGMTVLCVVAGGLRADAVAGLGCVPLVAMVLVGRRQAAVWLVACVLLVIGLAVLESYGVQLGASRRGASESTGIAIPAAGYIGYLLFLYGVGLSFEAGRAEAQRRLEEAQRQSEQRNKARMVAILDSALDAIVTYDNTGRILEFNAAAEQMFGVALDRALGCDLAELILPERLRRSFRDELQGHLATGSAKFIDKRVEIAALRAGGVEFPCEVAMTQADVGGKTIFTAFLRDITARKRQEKEIHDLNADLERRVEVRTQQLQKANENLKGEIAERRRAEAAFSSAEDRYRGLFENAVEGIFLTSVTGRYVSVNPALARMYGYASPEQLMDELSDIQHKLYVAPNRRDEFIALMAKNGAVVDFESEIRRRDGTSMWISESSRAVRDHEGKTLFFEGIVADISERVRASRALQEAMREAEAANQAKSEFLANMSHEIRTPMNAIIGFSDLLSGLVVDSRQKSYVGAISSSGRTLLTLINDILDLSKIEAGKLELNYEPVAIHTLVGEIRHIFSQKAEEKGLALRIHFAPDLPAGMWLDEVRLRQILFNVVGNALKFTEKGHVQISVNVEPEVTDDPLTRKLVLEVEDTGIGIPEDQRLRIFEAFSQMSGQSTRKYGGTGLGLTITRRLTEMMGGQVSVQGRVGEGSTFRFEFPGIRVTSTAPAVATATEAGRDLRQLKPATILVADDVELNRALLSGYFHGSGHTLLMAGDGEEALALAEEHRPEIVLMDVRMPKMGGMEAAKRMKENPVLKDIPVIAVTASSLKSEEGAIRKMCDGFLRKPVAQADLVTELKRFLEAATEWREDDSISASDAADSVASETAAEPVRRDTWPALLTMLRREQANTWPALLQTLKISQVQRFADHLSRLAEEHHATPLQAYAQKLARQAEEFDMETLPHTLEAFPQLIAELEVLCPEPTP